jgi:hypothetical protein
MTVQFWGNANNWANAAASAGYTVNNRPSAGAIMQSTAGAYGHVFYHLHGHIHNMYIGQKYSSFYLS